jgi:calcineurin-like phosphoesterase family protein
MSEVFFIADTHFGHRGIIEFSETKPFRPFASIEEHDEELVRRWNATVHHKDIMWHLGDFCFGKRNLEIAARLNGNKKLVMGNHDMYATEDYLQYFTRLAGVVEYKGLVLSHVPLHESQLARWYMNVHGHLHTKRVMRSRQTICPSRVGVDIVTEPDSRFVCVSAEQVELTPVPFDWILNQWTAAN